MSPPATLAGLRRIAGFWIATSLFCSINGFLVYWLAPQPAASAGNPWTAPTVGALVGLAVAAVATLAFAAVLLIRGRRTP